MIRRADEKQKARDLQVTYLYILPILIKIYFYIVMDRNTYIIIYYQIKE